jgi:hypothetical protein
MAMVSRRSTSVAPQIECHTELRTGEWIGSLRTELLETVSREAGEPVAVPRARSPWGAPPPTTADGQTGLEQRFPFRRLQRLRRTRSTARRVPSG